MDIDTFLPALLLLLSSFLLIVLTEIFRKACRFFFYQKVYVDLVFCLFHLRIFFYYLLPSITHIFLDWENQYSDRVEPFEVSVVYMTEVFSHLIYYITFYLIVKLNRGKTEKYNNDDNNAYLKFLTFLIVVYYLFYLLNQTHLMSFGFLDKLWMFEPFFTTVGSVLCFYLLILGKKYFGFWGLVLGACVTLAYLVFSFISGIRGRIFWPVFWMFFLVYYLNRQNLKKISILAISFLFLLVVFQSGMTAIRGNKEVDIIELINAINSSKNDGSKGLIEEVDYRFGALSHYSVGFYRMYERGYTAGLNPIINSLYSPIPRSIMPDKPVPGSVDGDLYSMGMYKTYAEIGGVDTNMVEFSSAAHAYWELGILGIIIFSILPAFYIYFCILLFRNFGVIGLPLFVTVFKPWGYNDPKIWMADIFLQLSQVIIPTLMLLFIYKMYRKIVFNNHKV